MNGSATDTTALISGPSNGVAISGGAGTVTNFGTVESTGAHTTIGFDDGGSVSNGSSTSTVALIANTGSANGVYIGYGAGTVTNFGSIKGGNTGVFFDDGGRVTNGASGSTAGLIVGTTEAPSRSRAPPAQSPISVCCSHSAPSRLRLAWGRCRHQRRRRGDSSGITGPGTAIYVNNGPGTVTNFGRITATSTSVGTGIVLERGGTVTNFGTVQNTVTGGRPSISTAPAPSPTARPAPASA